jgi:hypothetical protein
MFKSPTLTVSGNYAKATSLLEREAANRAAASSPDDTPTAPPVVSEGDTTLVFQQTNYSPKALSTSETYRNSKNLISAAKGALTKNDK